MALRYDSQVLHPRVILYNSPLLDGQSCVCPYYPFGARETDGAVDESGSRYSTLQKRGILTKNLLTGLPNPKPAAGRTASFVSAEVWEAVLSITNRSCDRYHTILVGTWVMKMPQSRFDKERKSIYNDDDDDEDISSAIHDDSIVGLAKALAARTTRRTLAADDRHSPTIQAATATKTTTTSHMRPKTTKTKATRERRNAQHRGTVTSPTTAITSSSTTNDMTTSRMKNIDDDDRTRNHPHSKTRNHPHDIRNMRQCQSHERRIIINNNTNNNYTTTMPLHLVNKSKVVCDNVNDTSSDTNDDDDNNEEECDTRNAVASVSSPLWLRVGENTRKKNHMDSVIVQHHPTTTAAAASEEGVEILLPTISESPCWDENDSRSSEENHCTNDDDDENDDDDSYLDSDQEEYTSLWKNQNLHNKKAYNDDDDDYRQLANVLRQNGVLQIERDVVGNNHNNRQHATQQQRRQREYIPQYSSREQPRKTSTCTPSSSSIHTTRQPHRSRVPPLQQRKGNHPIQSHSYHHPHYHHHCHLPPTSTSTAPLHRVPSTASSVAPSISSGDRSRYVRAMFEPDDGYISVFDDSSSRRSHGNNNNNNNHHCHSQDEDFSRHGRRNDNEPTGGFPQNATATKHNSSKTIHGKNSSSKNINSFRKSRITTHPKKQDKDNGRGVGAMRRHLACTGSILTMSFPNTQTDDFDDNDDKNHLYSTNTSCLSLSNSLKTKQQTKPTHRHVPIIQPTALVFRSMSNLSTTPTLSSHTTATSSTKSKRHHERTPVRHHLAEI